MCCRRVEINQKRLQGHPLYKTCGELSDKLMPRSPINTVKLNKCSTTRLKEISLDDLDTMILETMATNEFL
jgi:hypothetical protein